MEEASKIVSDAILGKDLRFVVIGGETYAVRPPSIRVLLKAVAYLSRVKVSDNHTRVSILSEHSPNTKFIVMGLAVLINGADDWKAHKIAKRLKNGTYEELLKAFESIVNLLGGEDFFALAQLAKSVRKIVATPK